jgi:hypothetical protein
MAVLSTSRDRIVDRILRSAQSLYRGGSGQNFTARTFRDAVSESNSSPAFLRMRTKESGRLHEIPLLFTGSTMAFASLFPRAVQSGHPWPSGVVLEGYVAVLLFLFWILRGRARMVGTVAINLEMVAWHWIPTRFQPPLTISAGVLFFVGWAIDFWLMRRASRVLEFVRG